MRVPVYDSPRLSPVQAQPNARPNLEQPDDGPARATAQLGQALGEAVASPVQRLVAKADALAIDGAELELDKRFNARLRGGSSVEDAFNGQPGGFLGLRGTRAMDASAGMLADLEKDASEVANKLQPRQREAFNQRAQRRLLDAQRLVNQHFGAEFQAARVATTKARQEETLAALAGGLVSPEERGKRMADVEASLRAVALSPEDGDADVTAFRGEVAIVEVAGLLAAGDVDGAEARFAESKGDLGRKAAQVEHRIDVVKDGLRKDKLAREAEDTAAGLLDKARRPSGFVDVGRLVALQEKLPAERRKGTDAVVDRLMAAEAQRKKEYLEKLRNRVLAADLVGAQPPGSVLAQLLDPDDGDPDFLVQWQLSKRQEHQRRRADSREARREQREANEYVLKKYKAKDDVDIVGTDPATFAASLGQAVDRVGIADMELARKAAGKAADSLEGKRRRDFKEEARKRFKDFVEPKGKRPFGPDALELAVGAAMDDFEKWEAANPGKDMPLEEKERIFTMRTSQATLREGFFLGLGEKKGPAALLPKEKRPAYVPGGAPPKPAGKVRIRRKADGKVREATAAEAARFLMDPAFEVAD